MHKSGWLADTSAAFRLVLATSWLAPDEWRDRQRQAVVSCLAAGIDWNEYLRLVDRHRIPALSLAVLGGESNVALPENIRAQLQERNNACRMEGVRQTLLLAPVLRGLSAAGIPAMPFKGQILSCELYGNPGLRQSRDIDLAVPPACLDRARICLESLGWRLDSWLPSPSRQWQSYLRHEHHLDFEHPPTGCTLELHWRNQWETPEQIQARWDRSVTSDWQGCTMQAMANGDLTLYLCSHGAGHAWARAKWLGDIARGHAMGYFDWNAAMDEAHRTGQEPVILMTLDLLTETYGLPRPQLSRCRSTVYPSFVLEIARENLGSVKEPPRPNSAEFRRNRLRMSRYERLLRPRIQWRDSIAELLYCRADFKTLSLPDGLFWAYLPLRPFLWTWRKLTHSGYEVYR